jgi:hypothetical protein
MATATTCKKCHATLNSYDATFCQGYCKACYNGTPLEDGEDNGCTPCDDCEEEILDALYEANDGRCEACKLLYDTTHFVCVDCGEECEDADRSSAFYARCQSCEDTRAEEAAAEALEAAQSELRELTEALCDGDDIDAIRRAVKALNRIK